MWKNIFAPLLFIGPLLACFLILIIAIYKDTEERGKPVSVISALLTAEKRQIEIINVGLNQGEVTYKIDKNLGKLVAKDFRNKGWMVTETDFVEEMELRFIFPEK